MNKRSTEPMEKRLTISFDKVCIDWLENESWCRGETISKIVFDSIRSLAIKSHRGKDRIPEVSTKNSWSGMIRRCKDKDGRYWEYYGSRGIKVCERWKEYKNFLADMGIAPKGTSIDRIDNDGNYEPENCRWATKKQQQNNQRKK